MKKSIVFAVLVFSVRLTAATLTDNFDNGISANLWGVDTWQTTTSEGYHVPVQMDAPDESGRLQMIKSMEYSNVGLDSSFEYGLLSKFTIHGNFIMSVDFSLINFPQANPTPSGVSDAVMAIKLKNGNFFSCYMLADSCGGQAAGVAGGGSPGFGQIPDFENQGTFGITRIGNTIAGWIDHGQGAIQLGLITADWATSDTQASLFISQYASFYASRSSQAMDVRFDNFYVLADEVIVPEPMSMFLLSFGGLMLRRKK